MSFRKILSVSLCSLILVQSLWAQSEGMDFLPSQKTGQFHQRSVAKKNHIKAEKRRERRKNKKLQKAATLAQAQQEAAAAKSSWTSWSSWKDSFSKSFSLLKKPAKTMASVGLGVASFLSQVKTAGANFYRDYTHFSFPNYPDHRFVFTTTYPATQFFPSRDNVVNGVKASLRGVNNGNIVFTGGSEDEGHDYWQCDASHGKNKGSFNQLSYFSNPGAGAPPSFLLSDSKYAVKDVLPCYSEGHPEWFIPVVVVGSVVGFAAVVAGCVLICSRGRLFGRARAPVAAPLAVVDAPAGDVVLAIDPVAPAQDEQVKEDANGVAKEVVIDINKVEDATAKCEKQPAQEVDVAKAVEEVVSTLIAKIEAQPAQ